MKIKKANYPFFDIVGDGAILRDDIGEGRFIPALIIDVGNHSEVIDLIKVHDSTPPGDAAFQWSKELSIFKSKYFFLNIEFEKPMKISFGIRFDLFIHYPLIDSIIQANGLYLKAGKIGDKISDFKSEFILLEVPETGFEKNWQNVLLDTVKEKFKKRGTPKKDLKSTAEKHIKAIRKIENLRKLK